MHAQWLYAVPEPREPGDETSSGDSSQPNEGVKIDNSKGKVPERQAV